MLYVIILVISGRFVLRKNRRVSNNDNIDKLVVAYKQITDEKKKRSIHLRIVELGMELVKKVASPIAMQNLSPIEDLMQVGAVGLIKAIDFYTPNRNAKFLTYANYFIKGEIRHYIRDKAAIIKTPRKVQELLFKIYATQKELKEELKAEPTTKQISERINVPVEKIEDVMKIEQYKTMISLDQTISSDNEDVSLLDRIPAEDYQEFQDFYENKILIEDAIRRLPEELRKILTMSFFEELNQREISEKMNISQMQVSRRLKKALNRMYEIIMRNER